MHASWYALTMRGVLRAGVDLGTALRVAFMMATPVNERLLVRGRGHAVVHEYHHHS